MSYDFIGFTYNGKHSFNDFGIYRTSDGNRYNDNLVPTMTDKAVDIPGGDGQLYFYTKHKSKQFSISIAFDNLSEVKYREMRNWLEGKGIYDLIFDEAPYKVYSAKVTGTPQLKTVCFDEDGQRIYKGEGTIQFTCYYPYAHTPKVIRHKGSLSHATNVEKIFKQSGSVFYTFPSMEVITRQHDYTIRIDVTGLWKTEQGSDTEINSISVVIGFSKIEGRTYTTSKTITLKKDQIHMVRFTQEELRKLDKGEYFIGLSSYNVSDTTSSYKIKFDFYLNKGILSSAEANKMLEYNGKNAAGWRALYENADEWLPASWLSNESGLNNGKNFGDLPAPFKVFKTGEIAAGTELQVGTNKIKLTNIVTDLEWDSKTGLVTGIIGGKRVPVPYTGKSYGTLAVGNNTLSLGDATIEYDYWYY